MPPFFRIEAVSAQQQAWLGGIQLIRPLSVSLLTACAVGAASLVIGYLCFGEYTRKARVSGVLVPDLGVLRLLAPDSGTVLERHGREGQAVKRGDVLFVLTLDRATAGGDAQASVQSSLAARKLSLQGAVEQQADLLQAQRSALERQLADRRSELEQLQGEAQLHRQRLVLAQQALQRLEALRTENFISSAQVQTKSDEVLAVQAQLQGLQRQRATQLREIGTLEAQGRELPLRSQTVIGEIERELAAVAQQAAETQARQQIVVRAPVDGVLGTVLADAGQTVSPALALANLVPADAELQAHLYAPSSALGFVQTGQKVLLRYQAYPYQKFGHQSGQVLQVARTPLQANDLSSVPIAGVANSYSTVNGEPLYRITVGLDRQSVDAYGKLQPLAAGMQLDADVQLDRRRLIEWLFEPLLGLSGRVASLERP